MIIQFQVIPTRQGDKIYALDDQGNLLMKQPQQTWRQIPVTEVGEGTDIQYSRPVIAPLQSNPDEFRTTSSLLDSIL